MNFDDVTYSEAMKKILDRSWKEIQAGLLTGRELNQLVVSREEYLTFQREVRADGLGKSATIWGVPIVIEDHLPNDTYYVVDPCSLATGLPRVEGPDPSKFIPAACAVIGFEPCDLKAVRIYEDLRRWRIEIECDVIDGWEPTYEIGFEELYEMPDEERDLLLAAIGHEWNPLDRMGNAFARMGNAARGAGKAVQEISYSFKMAQWDADNVALVFGLDAG